MVSYSPYDYLFADPCQADGIGSIRCPTLADIRRMTYQTFYLYMAISASSGEDLLANYISRGIPGDTDLFTALLAFDPGVLAGYIRAFTANDLIEWNPVSHSFEVYDEKGGENVQAGEVNAGNFQEFRRHAGLALGIVQDAKAQKFKNDRARKLAERLERSRKESRKSTDDNYELCNMVLKFCTHNKTGINLLNVGNLTYRQFILLFHEYVHARQADYRDAMAANTFSYKEAKDYDPSLWMEKIQYGNYKPH